MLGHLGWQETVLVVLLGLILFGVSRLPQAMRSFGRGCREFRKGMKEIESDFDLLHTEEKDG